MWKAVTIPHWPKNTVPHSCSLYIHYRAGIVYIFIDKIYHDVHYFYVCRLRIYMCTLKCTTILYSSLSTIEREEYVHTYLLCIAYRVYYFSFFISQQATRLCFWLFHHPTICSNLHSSLQPLPLVQQLSPFNLLLSINYQLESR